MANTENPLLKVRRNDLLELLDLVRGWQHATEAHLRGCSRTTYYISSCSESCSKARALVGHMTPEEIAKLPVSGSEFARSGVSAY